MARHLAGYSEWLFIFNFWVVSSSLFLSTPSSSHSTSMLSSLLLCITSGHAGTMVQICFFPQLRRMLAHAALWSWPQDWLTRECLISANQKWEINKHNGESKEAYRSACPTIYRHYKKILPCSSMGSDSHGSAFSAACWTIFRGYYPACRQWFEGPPMSRSASFR